MEEIKMKDWLFFHPYDTTDEVDVAYLNIVTMISEEMTDKAPFVGEEQIHQLAFILTAYLEDVVSGFGLWAAFRNLHEKRYGRLLPFVEVNGDTYSKDKINKEDLHVLTWMTLMRDEDEAAFDVQHPYDREVLMPVEIVYPIFEEVFERMPVNERLCHHYKNQKVYDNFKSFKVMYKSFYETGYLFFQAFDNYWSFGEEKSGGCKDTLYENHEYIFSTRPLAEFGHTYLREIIDGMDQESAYLEAIQIRQTEVYKYEGEENGDYLLHSFENGETYKVDAKSTRHRPEKIKNGLIEARLVFYKGKWHLTEVDTAVTQKDLDYFLEVQEYDSTRSEEIRVRNEQFMKANNNSPIAFFKNSKALRVWMEEVFKVVPKEIKDDLKQIGSQPVVVFTEPRYGLCAHWEFTSSIKHPDNPYYDQDEAEQAEFDVLRDHNSSSDALQRYLISEKLLPDLRFYTSDDEDLAISLVQENMDFMARFFWGYNYTGMAYERVDV